MTTALERLRTCGANVLFYRPHEYGGQNRVRVWDNRWANDQFEILSQSEFAELRANGPELVEAEGD